jgi:hypothetical protein
MNAVISRSTIRSRCLPVTGRRPMSPVTAEHRDSESLLRGVLVSALALGTLIAFSGGLRILLHLALRSMI